MTASRPRMRFASSRSPVVEVGSYSIPYEMKPTFGEGTCLCLIVITIAMDVSSPIPLSMLLSLVCTPISMTLRYRIHPLCVVGD